MTRIIKVQDDPQPLQKKQKERDLLCVLVEFDDGTQMNSYWYRITYHRKLKEKELQKKKTITEKDLEDYRELVLEEERLERSFDEDD